MTDSQKKTYFLSDFHLGAPDREASLVREKHIVQFLDEIKNEASHIFILGDLFDFWYEYKNVVPKGFVRILGKLAELTDKGIIIKFFVGNHDMWMNGYFENELGIEVFHQPQEFEFNGKKFFIGHGDGLGPGDHRYKFIKKIFRNKFCQWLLEDFSYNGATVMLAPATGFYGTPGLGKNEVRLAYVLNVNDLNNAMDCLQEALKVYPGRK